MQVIPAVRGESVQARLVFVESIHKRIKRLREAKKLTQGQLGEKVGVTYQSVQEWERDDGTGTAPSRKRQPAVAAALGVSVTELLTGSAKPQRDSGPDLEAKEEIVIELFRGLFSHQQRELVTDLRALFDANQIVRKDMGVKVLHGVSNEAVRTAFGDIPAPVKKQRKPAKAAPDDHMGDTDVE